MLLQKRTCSTLQTFLLDENSDEVLQRNVLKLLLNLLPICPKRDDDQKTMLATLDALMSRPNNTESVVVLVGAAKRNITRLRDDGRPSGNADVDMAEDGEVCCLLKERCRFQSRIAPSRGGSGLSAPSLLGALG